MQDSLVAPIKAVCVLDPAIDWETSDVDRYVTTRDPSLIQPKPSMTLTWAVLRPITVEDFAKLDTLGQAPAKLLQAFRIACRAVEGAGDGGGALMPSKEIQRGAATDTVWSERDLNALAQRVGVQFIYELGQLAYERAIQGNGWGGGVHYTLPQSSVLGLSRMSHRRAEQKPTPSGTDSKEKSSSASTPSPAASSGEAGDASAASGATALAGM